MGWYNSGANRWRYRKLIPVDHTKVGADVADFPTPIKITTTEWPALANAQLGGIDIVFTSSDGTTKLPHRTVSFDGTTLLAIVKATHDVDADQNFYVYCGCSTCADQQDTANVFPAEYKIALSLADGIVQTEAAANTLWLMKPVGLYSATYGKTYYAYQKKGSTAVYATACNHTTLLWETPVLIGSSSADSAHCAGTLAINASGYLFVFWGGYSGDGLLHMKKSSSPGSIAAWDAEIYPVASDVDATYPSCIILSGGTMVLFYRHYDGAKYSVRRVTSTDSGATWGNSQTIMEGTAAGDRPYFLVALGASDRVHLAYHYHTISDNNDRDLYYAYSDNAGANTSTWKEADGDTITLPMMEGAGYLVFNSDTDWDHGYLVGLTSDSSNVPFILYKVQDAVTTDKMLCFSRQSGAWANATVLESDTIATPVDSNHEIGDGDLIIIGTKLYAAFTVVVSGKDEIVEYEAALASWTAWTKTRDITTSSAADNQCPNYPLNANDLCRLIWMQGADGYDTQEAIYFWSSVGSYTRLAYSPSLTTVNDMTTNAHTGTKVSSGHPAEIVGKVGKAQDFDGLTDYLDFGDHDDFSFGNGSADSPFSIIFLAKFDSGALVSRGLIGKYKGTTGATVREWLVFTSSLSKIYFSLYDQSAGAYIGRYYSVALADDNAWHSFVITYSGSGTSAGIKIYRDAVQIDDTNYSSGVYVAMENLVQPLEAGRYIGASADFKFAGGLDEIRLIAAEKASTWVTTWHNAHAKPLVGESGGFWGSGAAEANNTPWVIVAGVN